MKKLSAVYVEWEDSASPLAVWKNLSKIKEDKVAHCTSIGYVVHETKDRLVIACSEGWADTDDPDYAGVMAIPKRAIIKRKRVNY